MFSEVTAMGFPVAVNEVMQTMALLAIVEPLRELHGCAGGFEVALQVAQLEERCTVDSLANHVLKHPCLLYHPWLCKRTTCDSGWTSC